MQRPRYNNAKTHHFRQFSQNYVPNVKTHEAETPLRDLTISDHSHNNH